MGRIDLRAQLADAETVDLLFQLVLGRPAGNPEYLASVDEAYGVAHWVEALIGSDEFVAQQRHRYGSDGYIGANAIPDAHFRVPALRPAEPPARILVTGSCLTDTWKETIEAEHPATRVRHILFNNASELEELTRDEIHAFDFQLAQIPLRSILYEADYFGVQATPEGEAQLADVFELACRRMERNLDALLKYNRAAAIPVFLLNFVVPQSNPLGRLMPRYALSNFCFFVEELNRRLAALVAGETNVHIVDFDGIAASLGKRYILDDVTSHLNHGGFIWPLYNERDIALTPAGSVDEVFGRKMKAATLAIFNECRDMADTLKPTEKIKIVVFDLDGTLWRGIPADGGSIDGDLVEGWPLAMVEAAAFLKKRGILVALASKNDPAVVEPIWEALHGQRFPLSAFVARRISWDDKAQSLRAILADANLLPGNCLFVDDNPIEREKVKRALPGVFVMEGPVCNWRRQLLWGRELQVPAISAESSRRTESVQAVIARETARPTTSDEDFRAELGVRVVLADIRDPGDPRYARAVELINKTNQFNATGRRWSEAELRDHFAAGGAILAAEVSDRYNAYGLTAALVHRDGHCRQMVMSCRTFGLGVEYVLFDAFLRRTAGGRTLAFARTDKNGPYRRFLSSLGLEAQAEHDDPVDIAYAADGAMPPASMAGVIVVDTLVPFEEPRPTGAAKA